MLPPNEEERICAALWAQAVYEMSGHAVLPANAVALARERGFYHIFRGGDTIYILPRSRRRGAKRHVGT